MKKSVNQGPRPVGRPLELGAEKALPFTVKLPPELRQSLEQWAKSRSIRPGEAIRALIERGIGFNRPIPRA
jgi:hypothetical protein